MIFLLAQTMKDFKVTQNIQPTKAERPKHIVIHQVSVITNGPRRTASTREGIPPCHEEPIKHGGRDVVSSVNAHNKGLCSEGPSLFNYFSFQSNIKFFINFSTFLPK